MEIHSVGFDGCDACDEDDEYADLDDGWVGRPAFTEIRLVLSMRILQQSGMPKVQLMGVLRTVDSQERDRSNRELDWMKCMRKLGVEATECRYCRFMEADKIEAAKHEEKCKQWLIKACRRREVKTGGKKGKGKKRRARRGGSDGATRGNKEEVGALFTKIATSIQSAPLTSPDDHAPTEDPSPSLPQIPSPPPQPSQPPTPEQLRSLSMLDAALSGMVDSNTVVDSACSRNVALTLGLPRRPRKRRGREWRPRLDVLWEDDEYDSLDENLSDEGIDHRLVDVDYSLVNLLHEDDVDEGHDASHLAPWEVQ